MRFKLTILLLALNVALFGLIFYIDKVQSTRSLYDASSRLILDPLFVQELDRIQISSAAGDAVWDFHLDPDGNWLVLSPVNWKANPFAIQQLLFQLRKLSWESRFPVNQLAQASQSLESYNLASPPLHLTLHRGAATLTLKLGAPTEIGKRLYMMSPDGEYVLVISQGLLTTLQRDMEAFLDRRIFGLEIEESRVMQIQDRSASNVRVRLERGRSGWRFVSPIEAPADTERVQAMIATWQGMEVESFEHGVELSPGTEGSAMRLTFEGLNRRETLVLSPAPEIPGEAPHYLAKREAYGAVFRVKADKVEALQRVQEDLRERRVLHQHAEDWTSLSVYFGELNTTLQQLENGEWQVLNTDPGGELRAQPADPEAIEEIRNLLDTMEAVRFVSDAPSEADLARYGLNRPQRRLVLRKASGETVELRIGGVSAENDQTLLYANTNQSASVFLLRPHILAGIPLNPMHYRERTIGVLPEAAEILAVRLVSVEDGSDLLTGSIASPGRPVAETVLILENYLRSVEVAGFLDQGFADPLVLDSERRIEWPYVLEGDVQLDPASGSPVETVRYFLSSRLGGTAQYLGDPRSQLVGRLPAEIIELLDPFLSNFPADPGEPPES